MPNPRYEITVRAVGGTPPVRIDGELKRTSLPDIVVDPVTRRVIARDLTATVLSLQYEDTEKGADKLTITVNNWNLEAFSSPLWLPGSIIAASWGYPGRMSPVRECTVQKVKGFQVLTIEALSAGALMHKQQRVRTFENLTRSQIVEQVAEEYGYGTAARFIEPTPTLLSHVAQGRMTDAALLNDLAKREGFEFYIDFDGLHWHPRRLGQRPIKVYSYYVHDTRGEIININIESDVFTKKAGGTTVKGIDPTTKKPVDATGDNTSTPTTTLAPTKDLFTGISARDGTETGTVERPPLETQAAASGSSSVAPTTQPTAANTSVSAGAAYAKNQLAAVKFTVDAIGDPGVLAKSVVEIKGIEPALSGRWYVTTVTHKLSGTGGYTMTMKWRREGRSATSAAVKPTGQVNESTKTGTTDGSAAGTSAATAGGGLEVIDRRDGTSEFRDTGGRTQDAAPFPADDPTAWYR